MLIKQLKTLGRKCKGLLDIGNDINLGSLSQLTLKLTHTHANAILKNLRATRKAYVHSYIILLLPLAKEKLKRQSQHGGATYACGAPTHRIQSTRSYQYYLCCSEPQMNKGVGDLFMKLRQTRLQSGFLRYPFFEFLCIRCHHGIPRRI